jgi:hypothetical protein
VATLRVLEVGVAAVDDGVCRLEQGRELFHCLLGGVTSGNHQPDDPWLAQHLDHVRRGETALQSLAHDLARLVGRPIERDDPMPSLVQPASHVAPHPAKTDDRELQVRSPLDAVWAVGCLFG